MPVWRNPDELQVGTGDSRIVLSKLTAPQQRLISLLCRGVADSAIEDVAEQVGVTDYPKLIQALEPHLIDKTLAPAPVDRAYIEKNFAELCRVQANHSVEGSHIIAKRQNTTVYIDEYSGSTMAADALLAAGVGHVITAKQKFKDAKLANIDVAITIDHSAYRPVSHRRWLALGVPQIAILFDQSGVSISPIIEVGKTPCLTCLQAGSDERQISIDSQLLFSSQRFDDKVATHFAIAISNHLALTRIDSNSGFELENFHHTGYRFDQRTGKVHELSWQFSEGCFCHRKFNQLA